MRVWTQCIATNFVCFVAFASPLFSQVSAQMQPPLSKEIPNKTTFDSRKAAIPLASKLPPQPPKAEGKPVGLNLDSQLVGRPLTFFPLPNADDGDHFTASGTGFSLTLRNAGLVLTSQRQITAAIAKVDAKPASNAGGAPANEAKPQMLTETVAVDFIGANSAAKIEGLEQAAGYANFMMGKDPAKWRSHVAGYNRVRYTNLYPGIDLIYYGDLNRKLEYDLVVGPGADPQQIKLRVSGRHQARIAKDGDLELDGQEGLLRLGRPVLYQDIERGKKAIAGGFVQLSKNEFGFRATDYDHTRPLIIDPKINLVYGTYAGGLHDDGAADLVLDAQGAAYVIGSTASQDFPVSGNALQTTRMNIGTYTYDVFLTKFDASGTLIFSTFLGGSQTDNGNTVALDKSGNIFVGGTTGSPDFPVTSNAFQKTFGGANDGFLAELSNDGSQLLYSTFLGGAGNESVNSMRVNADASLWIVGGASANGLPASATAAQPKANGRDNGFVAKLQFDGNGNLQIPYLTFIGGSDGNDTGGIRAFDIDSTGNVYVVGTNLSSDFPVTANAFEKPFQLSGGCLNSPKPNSIIYITKFNPDLSQMIYSTVVGGHIENQNGYPYCNQFSGVIHVDAQGNAWIVGGSGESDFPTTPNAISRTLNGNNQAGIDTVVFELSADGSKELYGTYLGGSSPDFGYSAAWDANNNIWLVSTSQSTNYPITQDALQPVNGGGFDTAITELSPDGTNILYSTFVGGSGDEYPTRLKLDPQGNIHIVGSTSSTNYPTTPNAAQSLYANGDQNPDTEDAFYTILGTGTIGTIGPVMGGDTGDTSITVGGAGFQTGATCSLVSGGTTIASVTAKVNTTGTSISCNFALAGAMLGSYDVVVKNPDGSSFTKPSGFAVQKGTGSQVWASVLGRPAIRTGTPSNFIISYGNSGTSDAYFTTLWVGLSPGLQFQLSGGVVDPFNPSLAYSDQQAAITQSDGSVLMPFMIPHIAAGSSGSMTIQITDPTMGDTFGVQAYTTNPWFSTYAEAINALHTAEAITAPVTSSCIGTPTINSSQPSNCLNYWLDFSGNSGVQQAATAITVSDPNFDKTAALVQAEQGLATSLEAGLNKSLGSTIAPTSTINSTTSHWNFDPMSKTFRPMSNVIKFPIQELPEVGVKTTVAITASDFIVGAALAWALGKLLDYDYDILTGGVCVVLGLGNTNSPPTTTLEPTPCPDGGTQTLTVTFHCAKGDHPMTSEIKCKQPDKPKCPGKGPGCSSGSSAGAIDPNFKTGPSGDGSPSHFVSAQAPFTYIVGFENEATATLPAAQVVVTDQLDPTKVDLSTLTLGQIAFGKNTINLPVGTNIYNTNYKLDPTLNVRIAGSLDSASGLLKWTFITIDPSTGQPPSDPTLGFLPPDTDGTVGQGSLVFNVMPKAGQSTGTVITNKASVVFDTNAAIVTPTWTNTLDVDVPVSKVTALAARTLAGAFPVSWSGTDQGSGIATYTVYVSDNGGAYTVWQQGVSVNTANFTGVAGHTYGFYTIATDGAGNNEAAKSIPDASTIVVTQLVPLTSVTTLAASSTNVPSGTSVTLTAIVSPPTGTTTVPTGMITFSNGTSVLGMVSLDATGKAALSTTTLPVGTNSITAQYGGDANFAGSTSTPVTVAVGTPTFTLALNPASATVTSGTSATSTITATSMFGFSSAVTLACSGLPANSTCSFSPASVTPGNTSPASSTLTISTGVHTSSLIVRPQEGGASGRSTPELLWTLMVGPLGVLAVRRRWTEHRRLLLIAAIAGIFALVSGCSTGPSTKTPAGTSTVTITGTSGSLTNTATLQLTVN